MQAREDASAALLNYGFNFFETEAHLRGRPAAHDACASGRAAAPEVGLALKRDLYVTGQRGHVEQREGRVRAAGAAGRAARRRTRRSARPRSWSTAPTIATLRPLPGRGRAGRRVLPPRLGQHAAAGSTDDGRRRIPTCWLNGEFLPLAEARISPLDRGFLFADGVYEVVPVHRGRPFRLRQHLERLDDSLRGDPRSATRTPHAEWLDDPRAAGRARRARRSCCVYVQVTRGAEFGRNHLFPPRRRADGVRVRQPVSAAVGRDARAGPRRRHARGHPLGPLRHQVGRAARQRAAAPGGRRPRRRRGAAGARRPADSKARRARVFLVHRRHAGDAAERPPHPARHVARRGARARGGLAAGRDLPARGARNRELRRGVDRLGRPRRAAGHSRGRRAGRRRPPGPAVDARCTRGCSATSTTSPRDARRSEPMAEDTLFEFPCRFPDQDHGRRRRTTSAAWRSASSRGISATLDAGAHRGAAEQQRQVPRRSRCTVRAESKAQLDALYRELTSCRQVLVAL